jgi:uncharacterized membrane protein YjfL (UPF0719 family)
MPDSVILELWQLIPTILYFVVGVLLFGLTIWLFSRLTPFSLRKEIEEDHNVAMAVILGSALIALAIVLAAAIK